jgi:hypothetical protein
MSTYWGYYCDTCQAGSPTWFNRGAGVLTLALAHWPEIKQALALQGQLADAFEVTITPYLYAERGEGEPTLFEFLAAHEGHSFRLHNEYGDITAVPATEGGSTT